MSVLDPAVLRDAAKVARAVGAVTDGSDWVTVTNEADEDIGTFALSPSQAPKLMELSSSEKVCGVCIGGAVLYSLAMNDALPDDEEYGYQVLTALEPYAQTVLHRDHSDKAADVIANNDVFSTAIDMFGTDYMVAVLEYAADEIEIETNV